ncbi:MAG: hypothetical protein GY851_00305 [bacterium]|nr:hypothetical protein [bacterium]
MRNWTAAFIVIAASGCALSPDKVDPGPVAPGLPGTTVVPLPQAHAHNDYLHDRPLLDALDHGFCSVEADIHLVDGELLVAHDRDKCQPGRTLQALYLDPLRERVRANGGAVYPGGPRFWLLIDFKTGAVRTYEALREVLHEYDDILTEFRAKRTKVKAVTIVLSGNRPTRLVEEERVRLGGIDGRMNELESGISSHLMPMLSDHWGRVFDWSGPGPMPDETREKLHAIVRQCHADGRAVRFWATPDYPELWSELVDAEVDLINTDNLAKLQSFLLARRETPK